MRSASPDATYLKGYDSVAPSASHPMMNENSYDDHNEVSTVARGECLRGEAAQSLPRLMCAGAESGDATEPHLS